MNILIAIIIFGIIIIIHELGHFFVAKANGIQVNEFCLGLGPTLFGFRKGETKYSIKLLPFGGACMMEGEDGTSDNQRAFSNKPVWARISVVFAGPFFNFVLAFLFSFILICAIGYDKPVLSQVLDGFAAQEAGMQAGDEIIKMNRTPIHFYREVSSYSTFYPGDPVDITYLRNGEKRQTTLVPKFDEESGRYLYGFAGSLGREKCGIGESFLTSFHEVGYWIRLTVESLKMLFTGRASVNDLSGPVGIVKNIGDTYEETVSTAGYYYGFLTIVNWIILLSANLGVMNLLPIPALDGGRLVFLVIEAIRRKKINPEKEGMVHFVGILVLFALMFLVMFNDIRKLFI